jgi:hypothetical protein
MSKHDDLVRRLLTVIDLRDWRELATLVTDDVRYDRPGYPTLDGIAEFLDFYRQTRIIADGKHRLESLLTAPTHGFCWGVFEGVSHSGEPALRTLRRLVRVHRGSGLPPQVVLL